AFAVQLGEVSSCAAGEIENDAVGIGEVLAKKRDLLPGFLLIAMRVELEVCLAEPFPVPGHEVWRRALTNLVRVRIGKTHRRTGNAVRERHRQVRREGIERAQVNGI